MPRLPSIRRLKLRTVLFLALLLAGIIPLLVSNTLLIQQNRERLEAEERTQLTQAASSLSREMGDQLAAERAELGHLGRGLLVVPGPEDLRERLRQDWVGPFLQDFMLSNPALRGLRVLDPEGFGPRLGPSDLPEAAEGARDEAFEAARESGRAEYRFVALDTSNRPMTSLAVPILDSGSGEQRLVLEALVDLPLLEAVMRREGEGAVEIFLVGEDGAVLWSRGVPDGARAALEALGGAEVFAGAPAAMTTEYLRPEEDGGSRRMLAQVSPMGETGWSVVVQKPASAAFASINRLVMGGLVATGVLVLLALAAAVLAARRVSRPIQRLAETSHGIAEGNFEHRVETRGLPLELAELGRDFNRMSDHVESYVAQLRRAAQVNRELFIGSIRAFAAAIDAKDPYTRGHSERVASVSRTISRHLGQSEEMQQRVWIGALLHDVGKIGVEDRVLRKAGSLTDEEFAQMKLHTVIGAEIMAPIEQLREMVPAIRWHHEAWNGRGYPDGKKGEEIPLIARIIGVADTFDAITTNRPYQKAYTLEEAIATITRLTGSRFDAKVVTAFLRAYELGEVRMPDLETLPEALEDTTAKVTIAGMT